MLVLEQLSKLSKKRKRIGRGGSRGATSGRGFGGQGARTGDSMGYVFEGGQMPLTRRLPKRGFNNAPFRREVEAVGIEQLCAFFDEGTRVTCEALKQRGLIAGKKGAIVKVLGGECTKRLTIEVHAASKGALAAIRQCGGEVILQER